MAQKVYDLTISYTDNRGHKDDVISAPGTPDNGLTYAQASLRKFISIIENLKMDGDPIDFYAEVTSVEEQ